MQKDGVKRSQANTETLRFFGQSTFGAEDLWYASPGKKRTGWAADGPALLSGWTIWWKELRMSFRKTRLRLFPHWLA